jgi:hypothetical protein
MSLSFMRRDRDTPNGLTEYLVVKAIELIARPRDRGAFAELRRFARLIPCARGVPPEALASPTASSRSSASTASTPSSTRAGSHVPRLRGALGLPRVGLAAMVVEGPAPAPSFTPRVRRWARRCSPDRLALVPWAIWLTTVLPSHEVAEHWDLAWGGFDLLLAAALLATASVCNMAASPLREAARRVRRHIARRRRMVRPAHLGGGRDLAYAIVLAGVAELPLASALPLDRARLGKPATRRLCQVGSASSDDPRSTVASSRRGHGTSVRSSTPR